jgi:hypothetical protein
MGQNNYYKENMPNYCFLWLFVRKMYKRADHCNLSIISNHISVVIVIVLTSNVVDDGFELWSDQTKDYNIGIVVLHLFSPQAKLCQLNKSLLANRLTLLATKFN